MMIAFQFAQSLLSRRALVRLSGMLTPIALSGARLLETRAQDAVPTRAATPTSPNLATLSLVQYIHPEKTFYWVPGLADASVRAALYDLDVSSYEAIRNEFAAAARGAAEALLADESFANRVDRLPFTAGSLVTVIGESDTDSLNSWFEILRHLLDLRRPDDAIELMNSGISAMTTTQAFNPFMPILTRKPDWIICALGANDAARIGPEPNKTLVSIEETTKNLAELRRLAGIATAARWVWLTRMPIDEARMEASPQFNSGPVPFVFRNADFDAVNAWIRDQPEPIVDIHAAFGTPVPEEFQEADGLHPTLAGHQAIAREFVERLAA